MSESEMKVSKITDQQSISIYTKTLKHMRNFNYVLKCFGEYGLM